MQTVWQQRISRLAVFLDTAAAFRAVAAAAAAACVLALLIAVFYMERYLLLPPCPLCILDRFVVAFMALGFGALALLYPYSNKPARAAWPTRSGRVVWPAWAAWGATSAALALGFVFAGRHIWLQNRPIDLAAECLSDTAAAKNLIALIEQAFDATADCGMIMWQFAGLTIPEQLLIFFVVLADALAFLAIKLVKAGRRQTPHDAATKTAAKTATEAAL